MEADRLPCPLVKDRLAIFIKLINIEIPESDGGIDHKMKLAVLEKEVSIEASPLVLHHHVHRK